MTKPRYLPPIAAIFGLGVFLTGRVHFRRDRIGALFPMENGEQQKVFREMWVEPVSKEKHESPVTLILRFKFARFSPATNRILSLLPVPVIVGMPGFIQKTWTYCDGTGHSQGIYLFESAQQAEAYRNSPVIRVLEKRTVKGSFKRGDQSALTPNATQFLYEEN